jgi:hypothetical protein
MLDWLQIQTGQNLGWGLGNFEWDLVGIDVYAMLEKKFLFVETNAEPREIRPRHYYGNFRRKRPGGGTASLTMWRHSLDAASKSIEVPDEYQLLRDAWNALDRGWYRRVLIDAGTAVELALTRALETVIADTVAAEALSDDCPQQIDQTTIPQPADQNALLPAGGRPVAKSSGAQYRLNLESSTCFSLPNPVAMITVSGWRSLRFCFAQCTGARDSSNRTIEESSLTCEILNPVRRVMLSPTSPLILFHPFRSCEWTPSGPSAAAAAQFK